MGTSLDPARAARQAREQAGLSQRQLARRAGTTQSALSRIESGLTDLTTRTLRSILAAAGFELRGGLELVPVLDPQLLDDVPRILALSPEERLRAVANLARFVAAARHG